MRRLFSHEISFSNVALILLNGFQRTSFHCKTNPFGLRYLPSRHKLRKFLLLLFLHWNTTKTQILYTGHNWVHKETDTRIINKLKIF